MKNSLVTFKGAKDGITVALNDTADFSAIEKAMSAKIAAAESLFGEAQAVIKFTGRIISAEEKELLINIIKEGSRLEILGVVSEGEAVKVETEEPEPGETPGPREPQPEGVFKTVGYETADTEGPTVFQRGSLRSGQSLRYAGSVVLMGDINAGAEIVAEGNVIVMGAIRGMAHAGCGGDSSCYVAALSMQPTQLRIADIIIYIPAEVVKKNKNRVDPVYAHIQNGEICISPLTMNN